MYKVYIYKWGRWIWVHVIMYAYVYIYVVVHIFLYAYIYCFWDFPVRFLTKLKPCSWTKKFKLNIYFSAFIHVNVHTCILSYVYICINVYIQKNYVRPNWFTFTWVEPFTKNETTKLAENSWHIAYLNVMHNHYIRYHNHCNCANEKLAGKNIWVCAK